MTEINNRTLTIERVFQAPIELVWEVWTRPEHIAKWWGAKGIEVNILEHDFREGGKWKYIMNMPDGSKFISEGVYTEIIEHKKIVTSADFKPMTEGVELHMLFEAKENITHFTFHCVHTTEEYCKQQEKMGFYNGWGSVFNNLEGFLTSIQ